MNEDQGRRMREGRPLVMQPFADLGRQLARAQRRALVSEVSGPGLRGRTADEAMDKKVEGAGAETEFFLQAMVDVTPLFRQGCPEHVVASNQTVTQKPKSVAQCQHGSALRELRALLKGQSLWPVSDTPEYVSGGHPRFVHGLHNGAFAVQAYCELHGLDRVGALYTCEAFFAQVLSGDKRCVALIHGRGLSSPQGPVLKKAVVAWLIRGPYRRFVLAFSSAPTWDGGAGVTYVLLRRRPLSRRGRRREGTDW